MRCPGLGVCTTWLLSAQLEKLRTETLYQRPPSPVPSGREVLTTTCETCDSSSSSSTNSSGSGSTKLKPCTVQASQLSLATDTTEGLLRTPDQVFELHIEGSECTNNTRDHFNVYFNTRLRMCSRPDSMGWNEPARCKDAMYQRDRSATVQGGERLCWFKVWQGLGLVYAPHDTCRDVGGSQQATPL